MDETGLIEPFFRWLSITLALRSGFANYSVIETSKSAV